MAIDPHVSYDLFAVIDLRETFPHEHSFDGWPSDNDHLI